MVTESPIQMRAAHVRFLSSACLIPKAILQLVSVKTMSISRKEPDVL